MQAAISSGGQGMVLGGEACRVSMGLGFPFRAALWFARAMCVKPCPRAVCRNALPGRRGGASQGMNWEETQQ